ncbi:MAG: Smr/MutS family protein [Bacteroidales bacterium]|nr:Smr/MutS family protein [Bacteroidales bacterium]
MNLENKIGFDKIITLLNQMFISDLGKSLVDEIYFDNNFFKVKKRLQYTYEFTKILKEKDLSIEYLYDLRESLKNLTVENTYLNQEEILKLWRSLNMLQGIVNFFKNEENKENYPNLTKKISDVKIYKLIFDLIKQILTIEGEIKDNASKELKRIRSEISSKESQVSGIVRRAFNDAKNNGFLDDEANITVRNGRMLIPVNAMNKNKLQGIVQDYSSTGRTVYIEPIKSVEINNVIRNLYFEEKREITKILIAFSDEIRPYSEDLLQNYRILAEIDFIRAKAKLAIDLECEMPIIEQTTNISLRYARHPLLLKSYKKLNKKIVPLDLELTDNERITLISGPNAGGKSIAIKTVGLLQYMVQCGFLVPVKNTSKFGLFDQIFADIGDNQSIDNDLSTYSSHLFNMKNIIEKANDKTLVIIDEFGSGTDPAMGGPIAEAILEELLKTNAKAVINTHYSNLKHFAAQKNGIINAAMLFDRQNLKPLYLLEVGRPGSSFAFEIAQNIGLSENVINNAKEKAGKNVVNFDKIIGDIEQQAREIRKERYEINKIKKELSDKVLSYRNEKEKIINEKKKIILEAEEKANQILNSANKSIEKTIKEIITQNAEKEAVKTARKEFIQKKEEIKDEIKHQKNLIINEEKKIAKNKKKKKKKSPMGKIEIGDFVLIKKSGLKGKVEEIKDGTAMIFAGNLRTFAKLELLEKIGADNTQKKININIEMDKSDNNNFVFGLDVRGKRGNDALERVAKYIDNALIAEANELTILHGTGDGILRNLIRQYLKTVDQIDWYGDADIRMGGQGITKVVFK